MGKSMLGRNLLRADAVMSYTALIEAATTSTQTLFSLPKGAVVADAFFDVVVAFADTEANITDVKIAIGVSGSTAAYMTSTSAFTGTASVGSRYADKTNPSTYRVISSATDVIATCTATGANFGTGSATSLDAGVVRLTVLYHVLPIAV